MPRIRLAILFVAVAVSLPLQSQTTTSSITPPPPQSARQALIEMLFGKGENDFQKHLPEDARKALIHKGETAETSTVLELSNLGRQLMKEGHNFETFDTGGTFLSGEISAHDKIEVNVDRDSLMGEADEIQLSVRYLKDGQMQSLPVVPDLIFTFKQEKEIWRLTELTAAAHIPLTNPDYLKGLRKRQDDDTELQVKNRIGDITGAEASYIGKHPDLGYSCSLQTLFTPDRTSAGENNNPYDPGGGSEEWRGYHFTLSGCEGSPPSKFQIAAVPTDSDAGLKTFCSDEGGNIKFLALGKTSNCFSRGKPVPADNGGTD